MPDGAYRILKTRLLNLSFFMGKKGFWIATIGILFGFAGGFFFANMLNRQEIDALKVKAAQASPAGQATQTGQKMEIGENDPAEDDLSPDEIRKKIKQADENPSNIKFQSELGLSLYSYAVMKKNAELLPDAKRLIMRAYEKDPKDQSILLALGNVSSDIGQSKKDNKSLEEARVYYGKALALKPGQADVQTDIGWTYALADPPEYEKALAEYRKSLQIDPEHIRTLDSMARAMIKLGRTKEAEETIVKLKKLDADYPGLADLASLLAQKK